MHTHMHIYNKHTFQVSAAWNGVCRLLSIHNEIKRKLRGSVWNFIAIWLFAIALFFLHFRETHRSAVHWNLKFFHHHSDFCLEWVFTCEFVLCRVWLGTLWWNPCLIKQTFSRKHDYNADPGMAPYISMYLN